jgi:hypothetical protein
MQIISHRGYWKAPNEQNSEAAFERSFSMGFGTETDFRDAHKSLVINHDLADTSSLAADKCFKLLGKYNCNLPLAINIKSDGLQSLLCEGLQKHGIKNYFLFDMSVPDAMKSISVGLRCFTRHSDKESVPAFYEQAAGVWMDGFDVDWITPELIRPHLAAGKQVCLVSPELHGRPQMNLWHQLRAAPDLLQNNQLMLCTDIPEAAVSYFSE